MTKWRGNPWAILLTLSLGFFMTLLDLTIVNIAIPSMTDRLDASFDEVLWVLNSYILVLAVLLITAGRLGDIRGKKGVFIVGVALFTLASLACGLAQDPAQLIAFRAVQGLGAALLMPQTMSIIIDTFPPARRGAALGVWGAVAGLATIAGPTLGGLLVTALDWRWIFFVNVPVGILVLALSVPILPSAQRHQTHRMDFTGVAIVSAALFCFTFALTEGQRYEWNSWIWILFGASVVLLAAFLTHQKARQDAEPLLPFALFRDRNFTVMNLVGAAVSVGMIGLFLPLVIYLQSVHGFSALKAGLILAPMSVVGMFLAPVAGRLSDRIGGKFILMTGLVAYGLGMTWLTVIADVDTSWPAFMAPLVVAGVGMGLIFAPMATEAMRGVPPRLAGAASGVTNTIRQVGSVLGSAAVGALMQHELASSLKDEATKRAGEVPDAYRAQFIDGFSHAAKGGFEVGAGQTGAAQNLPSTVPQGIADRIQAAATQVFSHGFVHAMKPTVALPIAVAFIAAAACLAVKGHTPASAEALSSTEPVLPH